MTRRWTTADVLCLILAALFMASLGWALLLEYTGGY